MLHVVPGAAANQNSMIFARRQIDSIATRGIDCQIFFLETRTSLFGVFAEIRRLRNTIRSFAPDIVHAHYGTVTSLICAVCTWCPLVIHYRGSDLNPNPGVNAFRAGLQTLFSQISVLRARGVITVSAQLRERLWWKRGKAVVVPSGVDTELFRPILQSSARANVGWRDEDKVVLFNSGNTEKSRPNKRLVLAREAVAQAEKIFGKIRLEVLDGRAPPDQMPWLINASDCILMTSANEGSPNIVKEALSCNVPVVSVRVGDVQERLEGVFPSFVVNEDPKVLGAAIADVLKLDIDSNGREKIIPLSLDALTDETVSIYRTVLNRK